MTIGARIKSQRKEQGISQQTLADTVGTSKNAISKLERGLSKQPKSEHLLPLAAALEVDANWLITGKGKMHPSVIPEAHYHYIDSAGSVPEFSERVDEVSAIVRTLSLHNTPIDDETRGEINSLLQTLTKMHAATVARAEHKAEEVSAEYKQGNLRLDTQEAQMLHSFRALDDATKQAMLTVMKHAQHR